ncbi:MAG: molybdate ABC transporter substrate-binding protein, partial [Lachnospiraceae bacterium]|nr:molybdate ABC transporter substrate-binding protein [Lachnospiraceae bacterium]
MKRIIVTILVITMSLFVSTSCGKAEKEPAELTILAAASLTDVCGELEGMYEKEHPEVSLTFSFG